MDLTTVPAAEVVMCVQAGCAQACTPRILQGGAAICGCDSSAVESAHYDPVGSGAETTCVTTLTIISVEPNDYAVNCKRGSCVQPCNTVVTVTRNEAGDPISSDSECDCP